MSIPREAVLQILYPRTESTRSRRFTQDSPILADVWSLYAEAAGPESRMELLLTPHSGSTVSQLVTELRGRLKKDPMADPAGGVKILYNESHVMVLVTFGELIRDVLPLSSWWRQSVAGKNLVTPETLAFLAERADLVALLMEPAWQDVTRQFDERLLQMARIAGSIALGYGPPEEKAQEREYWKKALLALAELIKNLPPETTAAVPPLWSVCCNREARNSVWRSRLAVKADAATRLFRIKCTGIRWAIVDSGVDALHAAFVLPKPEGGGAADGSFASRVVRTYDFRRLRTVLDPDATKEDFSAHGGGNGLQGLEEKDRRRLQRDLRRRLLTGQSVDWGLLEPFLRMPHDGQYERPVNEHGTHVAGIFGGCWDEDTDGTAPLNPEAAGEQALIGMCPDIEMYDLRVFDKDGSGDEFTVLAALQFIRYLNENKDQRVLHGVNLSMSLIHDVRNFACGRTPVCEEAERLVGSGVVVVASAGNQGFTQNYNAISITDPGNAEGVITVGATHRFMPHTYGVSYFSSRGPTGDGRMKPDLVAPGEKIKSSIPNGMSVTLDGTSMAAPHVSGAAALLMARHRELIGQPQRIKEILCRSATDLGREKSFQGAGMLDVLRAIQSV